MNKAAILTAGGICPGMNNVVQQLHKNLKRKNVKSVYGIKNGYAGLKTPDEWLDLDNINLVNAHILGGTFLHTSRAKQNMKELAQCFEDKIDQLYVVGGDGTISGAYELSKYLANTSIACIPKTIDNDILNVPLSFGHMTAVENTRNYIEQMFIEAASFEQIAIIKVMGNASGFLAMNATRATNVVDICLINEQNIDHEYVEKLVLDIYNKQKYVTIVAAESVKYIERIKESFKHKVKYLETSYLSRSTPANAFDSILCAEMAQHAVNTMSTNKSNFVTTGSLAVPLFEAAKKKYVNLNSKEYRSMKYITGQLF